MSGVVEIAGAEGVAAAAITAGEKGGIWDAGDLFVVSILFNNEYCIRLLR